VIEDSKTFCILPFIHLATYTDGSALLCCVARNDLGLNLNEVSLAEAWNSKPVRDARLRMLRGKEVSSCRRCYQEEAAGYRSHRVTENEAWKRRLGQEKIEERLGKVEADGRLSEGLVAVDLRLGNTCNLTCVMCRPQDSSKWVGLAKKLEGNLKNLSLKWEWANKSRIDTSRFEWYKREIFWESLDEILPSLRELIIGGGEPMLLEEHRRLIEACVKSGHAKHIQIRYHTNGTLLSEDIFELWKHFEVVEAFISLDGIGEKNTYMRAPASWEAILKNLRRLDDYPHGNLRVLLLCSIHLMSAFYLADYAQWVEDQNFKIINRDFNGYYHPGLVHYPRYLSVQALPKEAKDLVAARLKSFEERSKKPSNKIAGVLNFMYQDDLTDLLPQTREYLRKLDQARKTDFAAVMPELNDHLGVY